jgi:type VI secretion system protein ImpA
MAVSESDLAAARDLNGGAAPPPLGSAAAESAPAPAMAESAQAVPAVALDPAVAALCVPMPGADPCGPDLDVEGDADYLNFFAQVEGILPTSFFDPLDGKPFDRTMIDINGQLAAIKPLLARTRDIRLLIVQARLLILNRDLAGFAVNVAAAAQWLDTFWDEIHPRAQGGDLTARSMAIAALDVPTVVFPLQYAPLFEVRRVGPITYRGLMIATEEVKPRSGEPKLASAAIMDARSDADPAVLAAARKHVAMLKTALERIRNAFAMHSASAGLENLPALVAKIHAFIDPNAANVAAAAADAEAGAADGQQVQQDGASGKSAGAAPTSLAEASEALAAIADYYSRREPSSPTLPLVRQAHQLIGKSFIEIISILVPAHLEKAAFQIGADQFFELPVGKLSKLSDGAAVATSPGASDGAGPETNAAQPARGALPRYRVESRSQAVALLDQVQRYFRHSEPSSPVPMLCERARAFAERDFMGVLRDVLPKAALKNIAADK